MQFWARNGCGWARKIEVTATGATHQVSNSTARWVLEAGEPVTYYYHYNEFAQLFTQLLGLSAKHGPRAIRKEWTHVLTLANDVAIECLSTALVVAQRREPPDGILCTRGQRQRQRRPYQAKAATSTVVDRTKQSLL
jgi:hypothetical protein